MYGSYVDFSILQGLVVEEIMSDGNNEVLYFVTDGGVFKMWHDQDCCESVTIIGDIADIKGSRILLAEESWNSGDTDWGTES